MLWVAKTLYLLGHYEQIFQLNSFMGAILTDIIDIYSSIPDSATLTMAEDHKVCRKQSLLASFSCTFLN